MSWLKKKEKRVPDDEIASQLSLADKISRRVIHSSSAIEVVKGAIRDLQQYMSIEWAALSLLDEATQQLEVQIITDGDTVTSTSTPLSGSPIFWVISNKQALSERDAENDARFPNKFFSIPNLKVLVHMPLFYQGSVYGVISVGNFRSPTYMDGQLRLLKHSVAHLAISVKSALLMEQNLRTEAQLQDLNDLMGILTSSPELTDVLPDFVSRMESIVKVDRFVVSTVEGRRLRLVADYNGEGKYPQQDDLVDVSQTSVSWLLKNRRIQIEEDLEADRQFGIDEFYLKDGYRGVIRVPLFVNERFIGIVIMLSMHPYRLGKEKEFIEQLANYIVAPVESYLLYLVEKQRIDWLSALSHHLRTPLTPIMASSKMLGSQIEQTEDKKMIKLVENVSTSAEKMKKYLELFWDLSKVEAGDFSIDISALNLTHILDEVVQSKSSAAEARGQVLELKVPQQLPEQSGDPKRIKQIVDYLVDLSVEQSPQKSAIGIEVVAGSDNVAIQVTDSATTIADDEIESILRPYVYAEADMKAHPLLTLITAISSRLAQHHSGSFSIEAGPDGGNKYILSLPVDKPSD
jgi:K+-sensing histidine kinase KdpD